MTKNVLDTKNKEHPSKKLFLGLTKKNLFIAVAVIIAVILIDTFVTGVGRYMYTAVRCGRMPVVIQYGSSFAGGYSSSYIVPGDAYYKFNATSGYTCTEQEAKAHNINIDPFSQEGNRRLKEQSR